MDTELNTKIIKGHQYRIYPSSAQEIALSKAFGSSRWLFNYALNKKSTEWATNKKNISWVTIANELPSLKENIETSWLKYCPSQVLQMSLRNLDNAYTNFFKKLAEYPNFKSKHGKQSIQFPQGVKINKETNKIFLPKIGLVKIVLHREFEGKIKTVTIKKNKSGKYFASLLVETNGVCLEKSRVEEKTTIGLDVGIKDFLTTSTGIKIENSKFTKKYEKKITKNNRKLHKKKLGSKNRNKQRIKLAKIHEKISNSRKDFLHKVSRQLTNDNQIRTIVVEDLNVSGMMKNHKLAKAIQDCSWSTFFNQLKYKCEWKGINLLEIGRFEPSSKMCSNCGKINQDLQLKDREWVCKECGTKHDRDINAAKNILDFSFYKNETKTNKEYTVGTTEINASGEKSTVAIQENSLIEESPVFRQG
jgi:putative transposase